MQGIVAEQLRKFHEVRHAAGVFQVLIELAVLPGDANVFPEFGAQFGDAAQRLVQAGFIACHAAFLPEHLAQLAMERCHSSFALDRKQFVGERPDAILSLLEFRVAGGWFRLLR